MQKDVQLERKRENAVRVSISLLFALRIKEISDCTDHSLCIPQLLPTARWLMLMRARTYNAAVKELSNWLTAADSSRRRARKILPQNLPVDKETVKFDFTCQTPFTPFSWVVKRPRDQSAQIHKLHTWSLSASEPIF